MQSQVHKRTVAFDLTATDQASQTLTETNLYKVFKLLGINM